MSRPNKVNRDRYTMGGRLTPDEPAREHDKQAPQRKPAVRATRAAGKKMSASAKRGA